MNMNNENKDKIPEHPKSLSRAVDLLPPDTSISGQKHMPYKQSITQLCRGLLRRWIELQPDTKLRLRSHLRQYPNPSEENIIVVDSSDEENESILRQSQPKTLTSVYDILGPELHDKDLRNKYRDAIYKSSVKLIARDKSTCNLSLSDGVETGEQELLPQNPPEDIVATDVVPEYPGDANSTKHDDYGKSKSATESDVGRNIGTSRKNVEEGGEEAQNYLMYRSHPKDMKVIDDIPHQEFENRRIDDGDRKANSVKSNENIGKNSNHVSENHNFDRILDEGLEETCMISSPKSNILRENPVNEDTAGLEINILAENHTDPSPLHTELNITGEHQVNDDVPTSQSHILEQNHDDEDSPSPGSNILKELQEIDISNIMSLVHFDSDDESASIDNTNTEIDRVDSKNSKSNDCINTCSNLDSLAKFKEQNDSITDHIHIPENRGNMVVKTYSAFVKNVTRPNSETAEIVRSKILQHKCTEDFEIMKVKKVTKTYENYKANRKRKQSCESKSETLALHSNDTVHNENYSSKDTEYNDATKMKYISENVNEDTKNLDAHNGINNQLRNRQRKESRKLDVAYLFYDHNDAINEKDFSNTLENKNATNKRNLMDNNEIEESANSNSVDVNMIRRSSYNSVRAGLSHSEVEVVEDLKLHMHPVVVLRRLTNLWKEHLRRSLVGSPTPIDDSSSSPRSPIPRYKSPSPLITPRSSPYALAPKSVQKKRAWKKLSKSKEVLMKNNGKSRVAKRVELPDIEEVRRNNRNMLTAQVTPITQRQADLVGAAACGHDKCNIRNSTASVVLPLEGCSSCAALRLASPPAHSGEGQLLRGAAARARSFITSIAKKRKYISTKQYVKYNTVKFDEKPRCHKRRRRGRPRLASVSPHASANLNEDVQATLQLGTFDNDKSTTITSVAHFGSSSLSGAFSNLEDVQPMRERVTLENEPDTTITHVALIRPSPTNDVFSNLEDSQTMRERVTFENEHNTSIKCVTHFRSFSPNNASSNLEDVQPMLERVTLENEPDTTITHVALLRPSPTNDIFSNLEDSQTMRERVTFENEQNTSIKCVTHFRSFSPNNTSSNLEDVQTTQDRVALENEPDTTMTHVALLRPSPTNDVFSNLEDLQTMRELVTFENERNTNDTRVSIVRSSPSNDATFHLEENVLTARENEQETTHNFNRIENLAPLPSNDAPFVQNLDSPTRCFSAPRNDLDTIRSLKRVAHFTSSPASAASSELNEAVSTRDLITVQNKQENNTSVKPPKLGRKSHRRKRKRNGRPYVTSRSDVPSVLNESVPLRDFIIPQNEEVTIRSIPTVNELVPTRDLITAHKEETNTLVTRFTSSPQYNAIHPTRGLTTAQRTRDTTIHHRSLKSTLRVASVPSNASPSFLKDSSPTRDSTTVKKKVTTTCSYKPEAFASTARNYLDLKVELATPGHTTARNERRTKNSFDVLNASVLKETVQPSYGDIIKALKEKQLTRLQKASVRLTEEQRQNTSKFGFGFKPLLFRRGASAPSSCVLNDSVPTGDLDTAYERETPTDFSERGRNEVECLRTAKDVGDVSKLLSNICSPNVVADINDKCVNPIDNPEPVAAADDEFNPVIVNVQSLAPPQLMNKGNLQTYQYAPISIVKPNIPTITLKRANFLSVYASHLTNTSNKGQVFMRDARKQDEPTQLLSKAVDIVTPAQTYDQIKPHSGAWDPGSTEKSPITIPTLKKATLIFPSRLNSSSGIQDFASDSHVNPQEATKHSSGMMDVSDIRLPSYTNEQGSETTHVPVKPLRVNTLKRAQMSYLNSSSEVLHTVGSMNSTQHLSKLIRLSNIPSQETNRTVETAFDSQSIPPSSLPKITLKRAQPVYASYQSSSSEMQIVMSDSPMEEDQKTHLPRVVDVTGDLHVIQPDDRMGLHLVVSEELSPR